MASAFFKRLTKKYGTKNIEGKKYGAVIQDILIHNNEKISRAMGRLSESNYKAQIRRLSKKKQSIIKLPDMEKVLPKRSVFLIKAAESSKMIADTLRTKLESDLRKTLEKYQQLGGPKIEIQRGKTTGKINTKLIEEFQKAITKTFESYTKRDPKTGVPGNIRNISITEARSTIGMMKDSYNRNLLKKNPGMKISKTWIHNKRLSKKPRNGHMKMNGVTVSIDEKFKVDRETDSGYDMMDRPHDPNASAAQVIGCSCDCIYKAVIGE